MCAYCLEGVLVALWSCTAAASPWLSALLPCLLRLQELIPSEVQFVSLVVRKALVGAKYQPMGGKSVERTMAVLEQVRNTGF